MDAVTLEGVRGAVNVPADQREAVLAATRRLMLEMLVRNGIKKEHVVSAVFTATPDVTTASPAEALIGSALEGVPALCAVDQAVPGTPARCIRALLHVQRDDAAPGETRTSLEPVFLLDEAPADAPKSS